MENAGFKWPGNQIIDGFPLRRLICRYQKAWIQIWGLEVGTRLGDMFYFFHMSICFVCFKVSNVNFLLKLLELLWEGLGKGAAFITLSQWEAVFQVPIKWPANKLLKASTFTMSCSTFGLYLLASSFKEKKHSDLLGLWFLNTFLNVWKSLLMENDNCIFLRNRVGKWIRMAA